MSFMGAFFGIYHWSRALSHLGGFCHSVCNHIYAANLDQSKTIAEGVVEGVLDAGVEGCGGGDDSSPQSLPSSLPS